jgi:hypothetical protein
MSGLVRLDLGRVRDAGSTAARVRSVFDESDHTARAAADACGHDGLADAVTRFADSWDDRRSDFAEALGSLSRSLQAISTAFTELDESLWKADA